MNKKNNLFEEFNPFCKKVFIFSFLYLFILNLLLGVDILSCIVSGILIGAINFVFVRFMLKKAKEKKVEFEKKDKIFFALGSLWIFTILFWIVTYIIHLVKYYDEEFFSVRFYKRIANWGILTIFSLLVVLIISVYLLFL